MLIKLETTPKKKATKQFEMKQHSLRSLTRYTKHKNQRRNGSSKEETNYYHTAEMKNRLQDKN